MKGCELCGGVARMYCESDQASLCWSCDEKVHCANFLVAKHCRNLLCQVCQSPTPWKASGSKLGPTVSVCDSCFSLHNKNAGQEENDEKQESLAGNEHDVGDVDDFDSQDDLDDDDDEDDDDGDDEDDDEEQEEEDGENQVVPWTVTSPSPPVASSSSSEEEEDENSSRSVTRVRKHRDYLDSDDEIGCSSLRNDEGNSSEPLRPLKQQKINDDDHDGQRESRSTAIIDSLKRLQSKMVTSRETASAAMLEICRLGRDHHSR
ncbi:uncharacterized protein LOC126666650 [Mercurialis annua]|uniref:uncharacterized protein LOC126666650 n=1 Tax=Mercurialis annua TaxID=3986 RepID=UPI00215F58E7|nr:uncharacterized protein LOC126666650 [Mercurialis annua]